MKLPDVVPGPHRLLRQFEEPLSHEQAIELSAALLPCLEVPEQMTHLFDGDPVLGAMPRHSHAILYKPHYLEGRFSITGEK
jgi:hypothetical protein